MLAVPDFSHIQLRANLKEDPFFVWRGYMKLLSDIKCDLIFLKKSAFIVEIIVCMALSILCFDFSKKERQRILHFDCQVLTTCASYLVYNVCLIIYCLEASHKLNARHNKKRTRTILRALFNLFCSKSKSYTVFLSITIILCDCTQIDQIIDKSFANKGLKGDNKNGAMTA